MYGDNFEPAELLTELLPHGESLEVLQVNFDD